MTKEIRDLEAEADQIAQATKHYIIVNFAHTLDEASDLEVYQALCAAVRERVTLHWAATQKSYFKAKAKRLYYFSIEWLPGRFLNNSVYNLASIDLVILVMKRLNRNRFNIVRQEEEAALGNGGLGRLASCYLDALATHKYPTVGYGLRYQFGIFRQLIRYGMQIETCDDWLMTEQTWGRQNDTHSQYVKFNGELSTFINDQGEEIYTVRNPDLVRATAFELPIVGYSTDNFSAVAPLRLFSTASSPTNFRLQDFNAGKLDKASELRLLTDVLYPSDLTITGRKLRLYQEFLLASAGIQDMIAEYKVIHGPDLHCLPDHVVLHINDTHPALAIPELIRVLLKEGNLTWRQAAESAMMCFRYTNHTVLKESLEEWPSDMVREHFPAHMRIIERLNQDFCDNARKRGKDEGFIQRTTIITPGERVRMANLATISSRYVNGVAKIHSDILKNDLFKDFSEFYPDRFQNVTNGVSPRRFLGLANPLLANLLKETLGTEEWVHNLSLLEKLLPLKDDAKFLARLMEIKHANKKRLIEHVHLQREKREGIPIPLELVSSEFFGGDALFDVQIKRFHEYKRQLLKCLHILMLYYDIKENPTPDRIRRVCIFAGKAAPSYYIAKCFIRFIFMLSRKIADDPAVNPYLRVAFIENYNVAQSMQIVPAADLSEQISTAGYEASGTGCMKLSLNGALTVGTRDGANIEMENEVKRLAGEEFWPFNFGASAEEIRALEQNGSYHPQQILDANPRIARAMEALYRGDLAENEVERQTLTDIYDHLMKGAYSTRPDRYFVLYDLPSYDLAQKKVEALYKQPTEWAKYSLSNLASMGYFSADRSVKEYAEKIWGTTPCPLDPEIIEKIEEEFTSSNVCNIPLKAQEAFLRKTS